MWLIWLVLALAAILYLIAAIVALLIELTKFVGKHTWRKKAIRAQEEQARLHKLRELKQALKDIQPIFDERDRLKARKDNAYEKHTILFAQLKEANARIPLKDNAHDLTHPDYMQIKETCDSLRNSWDSAWDQYSKAQEEYDNLVYQGGTLETLFKANESYLGKSI